MRQASSTPAAYCRKCDYALAGLPEKHRCPECGREFDLGDPKSFRRRPRRGVWRKLRWVVYPLLLLSLILGGSIGWVWWEWKQEQPVIAWAQADSSRWAGFVLTKPRGPAWLQKSAGRWGYLLERVDMFTVNSERPVTAAELPLSRLRRLTSLQLIGEGMGDELMGEVARLPELKRLELAMTTVTDRGLARVSACRSLGALVVWGPPEATITRAGLAEVKTALPGCYVYGLDR